jgi:arylamine N-acetyltransferase
MDSSQTDRYLSLLRVRRRDPSPAALVELVTAHLDRVPFENVSKLVRVSRGEPATLPGLDRFLADLAEHGLGGTCYVVNTYLGDLMRSLGYAVELRGADMTEPDVHVVNVVALDGREHLVDVGYAAPFFKPMALERTAPLTMTLGPESYVLNPRDARGRSRLDHLRDGEVVHGYTVTPGARRGAEFAAVVADSYRASASFLNCLRLVRHRPERSVSLRDGEAWINVAGARQVLQLPDRAALRAFVAAEFGVASAPLDEALDWLAVRRDPGR